MDKKHLIGGSILAVVLLVLGSFCNAVGYQTLQSSNQSVINERINQKELLFQTIVDIANNKEIQRIILKSQMSRGVFPTSEFPVITKNQLKVMYFIGLILLKIINKSRIHFMVQKYQLQNPNTTEGMNDVFEKDVTLRNEITQLQNSECDCDNEKTMNWSFPVLCIILFPIYAVSLAVWVVYNLFIAHIFIMILTGIGRILNCFWMLY